MKTKPRKIAAVIELDLQELKYLLHGIAKASYAETMRGGNRDYYTEDLHDRVKTKLGNALASLES